MIFVIIIKLFYKIIIYLLLSFTDFIFRRSLDDLKILDEVVRCFNAFTKVEIGIKKVVDSFGAWNSLIFVLDPPKQPFDFFFLG